MWQTVLTTIALAASVGVYAAPVNNPSAAGTAVYKTCYVNDNVSTLAAAKKNCNFIILTNVAVPAGQTLDLTGLTQGTHILFRGTTTFGYKEWAGPLVSVSGTQITVDADVGAIIDGQGARWWDGQGANGGKTKPKFFFAHNLVRSTIQNLYMKNSPVQIFSINGCHGLHMNKISVDNKDGDTQGGHNTDAFDVGSSARVTITGAVVNNQDDCLAINSGTDISFINGYCAGGHGLSIGSVGGRSDNTVNGVTISDSTIANSDNGVRIKTVSGAQGSVSNVAYSNITLQNIKKFGIVIQQDYKNGSPTGSPTNGVPITNLTVQNVHGNVVGGATEVKILCGRGSCSNWKWANNVVTGGTKDNLCLNVPAGASC